MFIDKNEAIRIAKKIAEVNTALWNAACLTEELLCDETVKEIIGSYEEHKNVYKKIAKEYKKIDKNDEDFVQMGMRSRNLDDFDEFASVINEHLSQLENKN